MNWFDKAPLRSFLRWSDVLCYSTATVLKLAFEFSFSLTHRIIISSSSRDSLSFHYNCRWSRLNWLSLSLQIFFLELFFSIEFLANMIIAVRLWIYRISASHGLFAQSNTKMGMNGVIKNVEFSSRLNCFNSFPALISFFFRAFLSCYLACNRISTICKKCTRGKLRSGIKWIRVRFIVEQKKKLNVVMQELFCGWKRKREIFKEFMRCWEICCGEIVGNKISFGDWAID